MIQDSSTMKTMSMTTNIPSDMTKKFQVLLTCILTGKS